VQHGIDEDPEAQFMKAISTLESRVKGSSSAQCVMSGLIPVETDIGRNAGESFDETAKDRHVVRNERCVGEQ
jgi:hypothetical protein